MRIVIGRNSGMRLSLQRSLAHVVASEACRYSREFPRLLASPDRVVSSTWAQDGGGFGCATRAVWCDAMRCDAMRCDATTLAAAHARWSARGATLQRMQPMHWRAEGWGSIHKFRDARGSATRNEGTRVATDCKTKRLYTEIKNFVCLVGEDRRDLTGYSNASRWSKTGLSNMQPADLW